MSRLIIAVLVLGVAIAAAGSGTYVYLRNTGPLARAEKAVAAGLPRAALLELRTYTRENPKDGAAALLLGRVQAQLGDLLAAERELKRARGVGADPPAIQGLLGQIYLSERRFKDVLSEIPASSPNPADAARNLALRSRAHLGLEDMRAAGLSLAAAQKLSPANAEVLVATARLEFARRDPAAAATAVDAALAADPVNLDALLLKTQLLSNAGDAAGALAMADRAIATAPAYPAPRMARANLLMAGNELAKARADVEAILEAQPRNAPAIYLDGVLAVREGRFIEASERLQNLGSSASRFPRASYFQALAAMGRNLPATAVEFAERYAAQSPADPDGIRLLARAQAANRRPDLATKTLTDASARGIDDPQTLDQLGVVLASIGNLPAAADAYRAALAKAPGDPAILTHLANVQTRTGATAESASSLQGDKATADNPLALEALATAQIAAGELDKAQATIDRLRPLGATESLGLLDGVLAMARFEPEQAATSFAATAKAFPDSVIARLNLAKAYVALGRRDDARTVLADVLTKDPANVAALNSFVQLELDSNRLPSAVRAIEAARVAAPNVDGLVAMLSDVLVRAGDPARAVATIGRARNAARLQTVLLNALARAQIAAGQPDDAAQSYRDVLAAGPDPRAALALAGLEAARGQPARAKTTLDEAIAASPADFDLLTRRVQIETDAGGVDAALQKAAALRQDPAQMPTAAVLLGDALTRAGRPAEAAAAYRRERDAAPSLPLTLRLAEAQIAAGDDAGAAATLQGAPGDPSAALLRSQTDIRAQRWPDAVRNLELALRGRPNDPELLNNLAFAYQKVGDGRARATGQRAYLLGPSPDSADTLGWIMIQQGTPQEAVGLLQQAAKQRPADAGIAYHLALALSRTGQTDEAVRTVRAALAMAGPFDERADAQQLETLLRKR